MFSKEFFYWSNKAVSKIKYKPDMDAAYTELMAHMEDRCDFFLEQGMSEQESVEKTVAAMGDPEETADQLAAIHKPFWGYAKDVTKWLACLAAVLCLYMGVRFFVTQHITPPPVYEVGKWDPYTYNGDQRLAYLEPKIADRSDGYIFRLEKFAVWRTWFSEPAEDGRTYFDQCTFQIKVSNPQLWMPQQKALDWVWAEDSLGNRYECEINGHVDVAHIIVGSSNQTFPGTYVYECVIYSFKSAEADWVDLHYTRSGRDVVLRMDLKEGRGTMIKKWFHGVKQDWEDVPRPAKTILFTVIILICGILIYIFMGAPRNSLESWFRRAEKSELIGPSRIIGIVETSTGPIEKILLGEDGDNVVMFGAIVQDYWHICYRPKMGPVTVLGLMNSDNIAAEDEITQIDVVALDTHPQAVRAELDLTLRTWYDQEIFEKTYSMTADRAQEGIFLFTLSYGENPREVESSLLWNFQQMCWNPKVTNNKRLPADAVIRLYDEKGTCIFTDNIRIRHQTAEALDLEPLV